MFPILETERLILREIVMDDADEIFRCFSNADVIRYYGQDSLTSKEEAEHFVEFFEKSYSEKRGIRWGLEPKDSKKIIGTIGFNALSLKHKRAEIGYELHPDYWRKGYVSEAISEVIAYGFQVLGLTRIGAVVFIENRASNDLLTKAGFQKEGVLRNYMYQNGEPHDTYMYSLVR